ncbi:uncharacterized protein FA14DRAFT_31539 [Meira miltonrushii]|uniref:Uncharacterized protein n=1 Tax=Meira miltonrushii TaxID=1280837 RepID=A0A316VGC1_9BASI|nr:uncharacterized protein FA14DRAFT_31539 [Meira miltonrushii]PWN34535.1 hypothetical protein FA14DRAFT_31539 [Meira miltonrushii]
MADREQEQIDQEEFQPGQNEQAQEQNDSIDQNQLQSGASVEPEAQDLSKDNIIDDSKGPGGRSLRANRGDPTSADKDIDAAVDSAEQAEA